MKNPRPFLAQTIAALVSISTASAVTYQWNGSVDGSWQQANNWDGGVVPEFNGTFLNRLNVNGPTTLVYDASLGVTTYANTAAASRGLVIGSGALGAGSMTITGGTFSTAGSTAADVIGNVNTSGATSSLTIAGGNFIGSNAGFIVNFGGTANNASLNITSGSAVFSTLTIGGAAAGSATLNLDGGTVTANLINRLNPGASTATINFNGGTLKAGASNATFLQGMTNAFIKSGGAIIDSNGFEIVVAQPLVNAAGEAGKLTKIGAGTLTLTGASTHTGTTTISEGTLQIGNGGVNGNLVSSPIVNNAMLGFSRSDLLAFNNTISGPGGVTINGTGTIALGGANTYTGTTLVNAGRLDVTGTLTSNINVASGGALGGEGSTTGTITFNGNTSLLFDPSTSKALAAASVSGAGATVSLSLTSPSPAVAGIVVLDAPGGITGTAGTNFIFTGRGTTYLNATNTQLLFDYAPAALKWRGDDTTNPGVWDTTTLNWLNGATRDRFFSGDTTTFDDTATNFDVIVSAAGVLAGQMTFNNSENAYTVSGGAITGGGTLTKTGSKNLLLGATNSYTGGTVINGGSVTAPIAGSLGSGPVTIGPNGTLNLTGGAVTYTGVSSGISGSGTVNVTLGFGTETPPVEGANTNFTGTLNAGVGALPGSGKIRLNSALGAASTVDGLENATVYVTGSVTQPGAIVLRGGDTGESLGQLRIENGATWSGPVTLAGDVVGANDGTIGSNQGTGTISGVIAETGGARALRKVGPGIIALTSTNTYTGTTEITNGAVLVSSNGALGSPAAGTNITVNATLGLSGNVNYTTAEPLTLTGPGALAAGYFFTGSAVQRGALQSVSGNNTWSGDISFSGTNTRIGVQDGATLALGGKIVEGLSGSSLTFRHGNTPGSDIIISGTGNTWSGTTDIFGGGGAVKLGANNALPAESLLRIGTSGIPGQSTFDLNGFSQTSAGLSQVVNGPSFVTNNGSSNSTLTLNPAGSPNYTGVITDGSGKMLLAKTGQGMQTLSGINTYTGSTVVTGGTLVVSASGSIGGSTSLVVGGGVDAASLQVDGLAGAAESITSVKTAGTLTGIGTINGSVVIEGGGTLSPGVGGGFLTIGNGLSVQNGGHLSLEFFANFPGGGYDQVFVNAGNVSLAGDLSGSILSFVPVQFSDVFFIVLNNGAGTSSGTLNGVAEGGILTIGDQAFRLSFVADSALTTGANFGTALGNDVALLAVPEPATVTTALLGVGLLCGKRRRRTTE